MTLPRTAVGRAPPAFAILERPLYYRDVGRRAKYSEDLILDAAAALTARGGPAAATVVAIAAELGAPSGSIYHLFASRDLILAKLWIRTVRRFQRGYLDALAHPDVDTAREQAVLHVLRWSAQHPDDARVLTLHSREELLEAWPDVLGAELATLNDAVEAAIVAHVHARCGGATPDAISTAYFGLVGIPYSAVRFAMSAGEPLDGWLESAVLRASAAVVNDLTLTPSEKENR